MSGLDMLHVVCHTRAMPENTTPLLFLSSRLDRHYLVTPERVDIVSVTEGTGWQKATLADNSETNVYRPSTAELVTRIRKLQATIRTKRRNLRLGLYQGRNSGGDTSSYDAQIEALFPGLPHNLQGKLTAEHKLAERLSQNRDLGNDRPELTARLTELRRDIKELTTNA